MEINLNTNNRIGLDLDLENLEKTTIEYNQDEERDVNETERTIIESEKMGIVKDEILEPKPTFEEIGIQTDPVKQESDSYGNQHLQSSGGRLFDDITSMQTSAQGNQFDYQDEIYNLTEDFDKQFLQVEKKWNSDLEMLKGHVLGIKRTKERQTANNLQFVSSRNFFTQQSYNQLQDLESKITQTTDKIDDIEMKQIFKDKLLKEMIDEIKDVMDDQIEKFHTHQAFEFHEEIDQLRNNLSTTNMFDFHYKKDFVEFPSNEDTKFLAISELLDLKLEKVEWEYEGGYIRRMRFILNNNTFQRNFPTFGISSKV